jgi:tetratricopeptide (TPR) repeat protein
MCQRVRVDDWEARVADAWASIDLYLDREAEFRARVDALASELPDDDPVGAFERACAWDSTGHSDRAVPLYQKALDGGLAGYRRRRAVIQMSSSLRNIGQADTAISLLQAERGIDPATIDEATRTLADAISATLALCLADAGREREAVSIAVAALAPHLPRYQRSMANYARALMEPDED